MGIYSLQQSFNQSNPVLAAATVQHAVLNSTIHVAFDATKCDELGFIGNEASPTAPHYGAAFSHLGFIGAASGSGGRDAAGNAAAPLYAAPRLLRALPGSAWVATAVESSRSAAASDMQRVVALCRELADYTLRAAQNGKLPVVIGGDHSCAMGTWAGVRASVQAPMGLIWIDAHMDSHTPDSSDTGNIHGMPLAHLLGEGNPELTGLMGAAPKLLPEHTVLFGIRSYEAGEAKLLDAKGVRVFYMREITKRGVDVCFAEALAIANSAPAGFGVTFDIDALDPADAPATCCHEAGGLRLRDMTRALASIPATAPGRLLAAEFVELNPHLDGAELTTQAMASLIAAVVQPATAALKLAA